MVEDVGKTFTGNFAIDDGNRDVIKQMIHYFGASQHCEELGIDPDKGLLVLGPVGTGKTMLFKIFGILDTHLWKTRRFSNASTREAAKEFSIQGYEALDRYTKMHQRYGIGEKHEHIVYLFDDLGNEIPGKHYGQTTNVMAEIIQDRYNIWKEYNVPSHFTTNMTPEELDEYYGSRVRSRLREMCNVLTLTGKDRRK